MVHSQNLLEIEVKIVKQFMITIGLIFKSDTGKYLLSYTAEVCRSIFFKIYLVPLKIFLFGKSLLKVYFVILVDSCRQICEL